MHTQLVSSVFLDNLAYQSKVQRLPQAKLFVFDAFIEQRIEQAQIGSKQAVDLVNGHEETHLKYKCG